MNMKLNYEITQFLYQEANFLDHRKYNDWLTMLSDDIEYSMPVRVTVDNKLDNIVKGMSYFEDSREDLQNKVDRLYTRFAWVDNPAPRQRHFISNVMVAEGDNKDEYKVRSYFLFKRSRSSDVETEEIFGEREDVIKRIDGELKLTKRIIYPDQSVLTVANIAMFL